MWTIKESHNGKDKVNLLSEMQQKLLDLKSKITELQSIEVGINGLNAEKNHDLVLITEFNNADDLATYATHPEHLKVVDFVKEISTGRAAVDFKY